jgi:hypothetical protein
MSWREDPMKTDADELVAEATATLTGRSRRVLVSTGSFRPGLWSTGWPTPAGRLQAWWA